MVNRNLTAHDFTAKSLFFNDFHDTQSISLSRPFPLAARFFLLYRIDSVLVKVMEMEKSSCILDGIFASASNCIKCHVCLDGRLTHLEVYEQCA
jgi:hypothetical protein